MVIYLNSLLPIFEELEIKRKELLLLEKGSLEAEQKLSTIAANLQKHKNLLKEQKLEIEKLEELLEPLDSKVQQLTLLQAQHNKLQEYKVVDQELHILISAEAKQQDKFEQCKETYEDIEQQWLGNQASLIASKLVEGEPCPVCGSKEHSTLHIDIGESFVDEGELRMAKAALNKEESTLLTFKAKKKQQKLKYKKCSFS